jgi:integrase
LCNKFVIYQRRCVLYWSGMRKGELLALKWSRIDFRGATVDICESYQRLRGKAVITPTKTGESRIIRLPDVCMQQLIEYRKCIYDPAPDDFVFNWEKRFIETGISQGSKAAGVKRIHVHGLRHSHASASRFKAKPRLYFCRRLPS